ncbi:MAG: flagellar motor switch protein FliN [Chitinivibrionales bacterium]|nr:flagellar motor switch protein FliN [Chitinivibrionales bacterium]
MSEPLSEDQINDLLAENESTDVGADSLDNGTDETTGAAKDYAALKSAVELFDNHAQTVLTTVLNKQIGFSVFKCEKTDAAALQEAVTGESLALKIVAEGAVGGDLYMVIAKKTVAMLSDLMMMGDGSADYTEDHKDAISELTSQMINPFGVELGEKFGESVSFGNIEVSEYDPGSPPFDTSGSDMAILEISVEDMEPGKLALIIPGDMAAELISRMGSAGESAGSQEGDDGIGLSSEELNDLAGVSSDLDDSGSFQETPASGAQPQGKGRPDSVEMLMDVDLDVSIELGRTNMSIKRILELAPGSIVELERMAGEPVDLMVNDKVVAKGEVVVVDENFGIRIVSLVSAEERIRSLR